MRVTSSSVSRSSSRVARGILRLQGIRNTVLVAPAMVLVGGRRAGASISGRPHNGTFTLRTVPGTIYCSYSS